MEQLELFDNKKDWKGNTNSIFKTLGASNHTEKERQKQDYYATEPKAAELLLQVETFSPNIWECACGEKHLAKVFEAHGFNVRSSDIVDRCGNEVYDFLSMDNTFYDGDIITNPPFRPALDFVYKALSIIPEGRKVAMFLKVQFLEGKTRKELYKTFPPKYVYVFSERINCAMNGDFDTYSSNGAVAYAWYIWEKGFKGETTLRWI